MAGLNVARGGLVTDFSAKANDVIDLGNGANMRGAVKSGFDVGIEFGGPGVGKGKADVAGPVSFTLTNAAGDLTLDDIANTQFGARLTSVGNPAGSRNDSAKLVSVSPAAPDARDDTYSIFEDGQSGLDDPSTVPEGVLFQVLANDTDADGQALTVTQVAGALHGTTKIVDGNDADSLPGDAILYTPFEDYSGADSFEYCITDGNGGQDGAKVDVAIAAVADVPTLDVVVSAGSAVNKILVTVTATQTDADSSEFIDRIELSGLPAGVTATPLGLDPATEPDSLAQVFELTLPEDQDTDFVLGITATSKETSNGDTEVANGSLRIQLNQTLTEIEATFLATDQSIWSTGNQFTFTDDRFIGIDTSWDETAGSFLYGHTDGRFKAGFQSTLNFAGGEIDAQAVYDVSVETLYNKTTDVLFLTADALFDPLGSSFTTEGPDGSYKLDFIFDFLLRASAGVDAGVDSFDIFSVTIGPYQYEKNIIDFDSTSGTAVTVDLPAGFSLTFAWPDLDTTSDPGVTNVILSDGASNNFFQVGLDVDDLVFTLLGIPNPFNFDFDVGVAEGNIQVADLDLSFGMNFLQEFAMAAGALAGTITFEDGSSQAFDFNTDITLTDASSRDSNADGSIAYTLELTPAVTLNNDTDLGFNFGVQFDVLKVTGSYDIGVDSGSLNLGPVFSTGTTVPLGSVDVYDNTFALNFGSQDYIFAA